MVVALELLAAFVLIVGGAIGFTNAVEWLGHRLNLGAGAVGAILAAVGTALPESIIPVVALVRNPGDPEAVEIAIGAIIGAPFLLGTVAMLLVAGSAIAFRDRREQNDRVEIDPESTRRDLHFFLAVMPIGLVIGALALADLPRIVAAVLLVLAYLAYTARTIKRGGDATDEELKPLYFDRSKGDPPNTAQITTQFVVSLGAIILGAVRGRGRSDRRVDQRRATHRRPDSRPLPSCPRRPTASSGCGREGHPRRREHHRGDGVSVDDPGRPRTPAHGLGPGPLRDRRRGGGHRRRRAGALRAPAASPQRTPRGDLGSPLRGFVAFAAFA